MDMDDIEKIIEKYHDFNVMALDIIAKKENLLSKLEGVILSGKRDCSKKELREEASELIRDQKILKRKFKLIKHEFMEPMNIKMQTWMDVDEKQIHRMKKIIEEKIH